MAKNLCTVLVRHHWLIIIRSRINEYQILLSERYPHPHTTRVVHQMRTLLMALTNCQTVLEALTEHRSTMPLLHLYVNCTVSTVYSLQCSLFVHTHNQPQSDSWSIKSTPVFPPTLRYCLFFGFIALGVTLSVLSLRHHQWLDARERKREDRSHMTQKHYKRKAILWEDTAYRPDLHLRERDDLKFLVPGKYPVNSN